MRLKIRVASSKYGYSRCRGGHLTSRETSPRPVSSVKKMAKAQRSVSNRSSLSSRFLGVSRRRTHLKSVAG
eukprot:3186083-Prymnesium_polylepis.1